jgi:hypothetical protein
MAHENLEKSEIVIARILNLLLERGIRGGDLEFSDLSLDDDFLHFFAACFRWLIDEGIVRAQKVTDIPVDEQAGMDDLYVYNPTITAHGFNVLGRSVVIGTETLAASIVVQRVSANDQSYSGFGDFAGGFVGGLLKVLGS